MQLFKYDSETRDLFTDGFIRLSQLSVLNDPFEASFCPSSLDKLASNFDDETTLGFGGEEIAYSAYAKKHLNDVGVICFSENKENLLMWSHYANDHKGIAVGIVYLPSIGSIFENLKPVSVQSSTSFSENWSPFDGSLKPVSYRKGLRYKNDMFDYDYSNIIAEGGDRTLYEIFMQKSEEWIYEQEHRAVLKLEQADRVIFKNLYRLNEKARKKILDSPHTSTFSSADDEACYQVELCDFEDDNDRDDIAGLLVKLSHDPSTIYLMKLAKNSINCCLFGLNSDIEPSKFMANNKRIRAHFNVYKAVKNKEHYCIDFVELNI